MRICSDQPCIVLLTEKDVWIRVNGKEPISLKANHMALLNCENNIIDVSSLNNTLVAHISHDIIKDYLRFLNKDLSQIPVWQRSATPILTLPCLTPDVFQKIQSETDIPIVIVHGPKGEDKARVLVDCYNNVYRLSLSPSIKRSAAIIKDAYIAITPDTSILHMASAYNTPVVAIYADYKTRWPAMADVSESVVVGQKIDNISLDEFAKALKSVLARI